MLAFALSIFFIKISLGILPCLAWVQRKDTGTGFFRLLLSLAFLFGLLSLILYFRFSDGDLGLDSFSPLIFVINFLLGALLLGSALTSMILGHWYLIRSKLSFHYLIRAVWISLILAILRLSFVLGVALVGRSEPFMDLIRQMDILLLTRFLWGGVLPVFFLFLSLQCAKIHSNRSCTGILYFTTASVFMGELMADYLSFIHRMPF